MPYIHVMNTIRRNDSVLLNLNQEIAARINIITRYNCKLTLPRRRTLQLLGQNDMTSYNMATYNCKTYKIENI